MSGPPALPEKTERIATQVVDSAVKVHSALGPGLLESVYETCLCIELKKRAIRYEKQIRIPVVYDGISIDSGLRLHLLVGGCVIVELKSVERLLPVHDAQVLTYLKLAEVRLGLLLNFNVPLMKQGIRRIIL
jgi:GxxExxY protein